MDQHVGLIPSTILHLCASSKHSRVKCTCLTGAGAFRTKASWCQFSEEFIHFLEMEEGGQKKHNRKWRTLILLLHMSLWLDICLLLKDNACFFIRWYQSIFLMRSADEVLHSRPSSHHSSPLEAQSCLRRQNQAGYPGMKCT